MLDGLQEGLAAVNLGSTVVEHDPDKIALFQRGQEVSYGQLRAMIDGFRGGLVERGIKPGDRVALVFANTLEFVVSFYATLGAGAVAVPLNPLSPAPEMGRELEAIAPAAAIVGPAGRRSFAGLGEKELAAIDLVIAPIDAGLVDDELIAAVAFADVIDSEPAPIVDLDPDAPAVMMFTSGTAGLPKAAVLTHANLDVNQRQMMQHAGDLIRHDDVAFGVLPFFHIYGLNAVLGISFRIGAAVVLVERFDPATALETIERRRVTNVLGPPTLWSALAAMPTANPAALASVRLASSGASKLPDVVAQMCKDRLGLSVREAYGLTEAAPAVTSAIGTDAPLGSIGSPMPGMELRIIDPMGDDVLIGDEGELLIRGPNVFPGYFNEPEATSACIDADGWLHTGDIALVDDNGYLYIVDRAKDLVIVSGFNVYPAEVEAVLMEHPSIEDVAVAGVEHPHTGEAVRAYVVPRSGEAIDEHDVVDFCTERLAHYKCPSKVTFVESIPHGLAGKILRRELPS